MDNKTNKPNPNVNGHLHYPNDLDGSLKEAAVDKIRKYRADYNNNPPNSISFMSAIASTSGSLHSELVRLLFLQDHRETDHFFATSGVQLTQSDRVFFFLLPLKHLLWAKLRDYAISRVKPNPRQAFLLQVVKLI